MTDSNRTQVAYIEEATLNTTPAVTFPATGWSNLRMARITGEGLGFAISNTVSDELRADRQISDLIQNGAQNAGNLDFEFSFPQTRTFLSDFIGAAFFSDWLITPEFFNTTADSTITDAGTTTNTYQVASGGASVVTGHLVRASGFTNTANNQLFRATSSTGTTIVGTGLGLTAEAAPPAGARLKVVGAEGATGDIAATGTGLSSTTLDFTTLGLRVGQWVKIGGAAGNSFNTAANNDWVRVTAIAANALTFDNRPSGWAVDAGTGKAIRLWFGDVLRNGTTRRSFTIEKGFLAQTVPTYALYRGMVPGTLSLNWAANEIIKGQVGFLGTTHQTGTVALGTPAPATALAVLNAVNNVGRIAEGGATVAGPNFIRSLSLAINNNLREQVGIGTLGLVGIGVGRFEATGQMMTYFGSSALYDKYVAGAASSVSVRNVLNGQSFITTFPNIEFESGSIVARGRDQDVMCELGYRALLDTATGCMMQMDRVEEFA